MLFRIRIVLLVSVGLVSCMTTLKPAAKKGGVQYYETFFVGEGITQYYIKPVGMMSGDKVVLADFTAREKQDNVTMNLSFLHTDSDAAPDSIRIHSSKGVFSVLEIKLLYIDHQKGKATMRLTSWMHSGDFKEAFGYQDLEMRVYPLARWGVYSLTKNGRKRMGIINDNIMGQIGRP